MTTSWGAPTYLSGQSLISYSLQTLIVVEFSSLVKRVWNFREDFRDGKLQPLLSSWSQ